MKSSKKSARPSQKEADVDVDEFARQFFGTDEDYNHKMPPKSLPIQQEKSRDPHKTKNSITTPHVGLMPILTMGHLNEVQR